MFELYQAEGCGYSANVRETLTALGLSYVIHNLVLPPVRHATNRPMTSSEPSRGNDQIPFIIDHQHGVTMYESDDIVAYLEEHYA